MSSNPAAKAPPPKQGSEQSKPTSIPNPTNQTAATTSTLKIEDAQRRQAAQEASAIQRKKEQSTRTLGLMIALFIVVGGGALTFFIRDVLKPKPPGELVPMMQSYHLTSGDEPHPTYTTDPPTSGPHIGSLPDWGVHSEPITKEIQVHVLEDAGVVINYRPDLDKPTIDRLAALTRSYSDLIVSDSEDNHVVTSPYPGLSNPIVLTAWRHVDRLDSFDEVRIKRFVDSYKNIDHHVETGDRPGAATPTAAPPP